MKLFITVILIFFLLIIKINAQQFALDSNISNIDDTRPLIDTTDFFPLQIGNYWEYAATTGEGPVYFGTTVTGDTLMPNGKTYKILKEKYLNIIGEGYTWYFRKDSSQVYYSFPYSQVCTNEEYKYLDFDLKDSSSWPICRDLGMAVGNSRGIARTFYDYTYYHFLQKSLETKQFEDVYIDSSSTTWTPGEGSKPIRIAKGIGIIRQFIFSDGDYWLQGAIINGVKFGTITHVKDEKITIPADFNISNHPNPFNPTTTINYTLPESGIVQVKIFDVLGRELKTLVNEYSASGLHSVKWDGSNYSSGIYFCSITFNGKTLNNKMLMMK